ncbi:MAG: SusC/RagA family TonB-linked outer membrane protein [Saprospiraceae bacterium]
MNQKSYYLPKGMVLLMLLFFLASGTLLAQRTVSGTVSDPAGPLPGVNVLVKGTTTGTATDENGQFQLTIPSDNSILVFSATGFRTVEVAVGAQTTIDVNMEEDAVALSEVVVTGYSVESRRQATGAVSTVKSKDLVAIPSGNVEQQLQGRVPGVTVITNGQPGTTSQIRVRGFGAFGGNAPLYVVDGVPVGNVDFLAPDDIESTTVLKDAASASIYGARAANGVVVFTTKHGKRGEKGLRINYDAVVGITDPGEAQEILNPQEQADWTWIALKNSGLPTTHPQYGSGATPRLPDFIKVGDADGIVGSVDLAAERAKYNVSDFNQPIYQVMRANKAGTNWYDEITRTAPLTRHTLGFSGASDGARFYASLSLQEQAGILIHQNFRRYSARINTEFDLGKRVRIGQNLQGTYRQVLLLQGGEGGIGAADDENVILSAFRMSPIIPVYDEFGGYAGTRARGFNNPRNPVAELDGQKDNRGYSIQGFGNVYVEWDVIDGLTLRSSIGGNYGNFAGFGYGRRQYENSENNSSFSYSESYGHNFGWTFTNTANYKKKFGVHGIDLLGGLEALNTGFGRNINGSGLNPFSQDPDYITLNTVGNRQVFSGLSRGITFYSLFGRVNYSLNDKYYITGVVRRDGSSRFGANNRYGVFPAISAAWRVTGEEFMKGLDWITDLKIRGGWGEMGNSNNVASDNQFNLFSASLGNASYAIDGSNTAAAEGFSRSRIGNPDARWETSTTTNIGIDGSFFNGKLDVIFDWWEKNTEDLLYRVPIPHVIGDYATPPDVNIGSMLNRGFDIQIINRGKITGDLGYEVNLTGSWLKNEITEIAPNVPFFGGGDYRGIQPIRNQPGQSLSAFFGYQMIGYFKDAAEVASAPTQPGAAPGRFRFADLNGRNDAGELTGRPDGKVDEADRTFIGSPVPDFTSGVNIRLTFKNFDLETYIYTSIGNEIFNVSKWFTDFYPSFTGAAISARVRDSWTPNNLDASTPIFENVSNFSTNTQSSSWYVEDGSFLRMQNLSIGYTVPQSVLEKIGFRRLRVFAATNNLFTITKYSGLDPGVGGGADTNFGVDLGNYPITRSVTFGLNVGF